MKKYKSTRQNPRGYKHPKRRLKRPSDIALRTKSRFQANGKRKIGE